MKKSKYQQYFHCFIVCILVPSVFRGAAFKGRRLFQCGYPKVRRLFEARRLLEEIRYLLCEVKNGVTVQVVLKKVK